MEYRWYAIQTTAGHENKVRNLLQRRIADDPRPAEQKLIRQALVPVQEVIEIKNGKKVNVERKLYPGYVLVEMAMGQEALHVVNSIQGVIKFVGTGKMPQPLRQDEVNRLLGIAEAVTETEPKEEIPFMVGQVVEGDGESVRPPHRRRNGLPAAAGALSAAKEPKADTGPFAPLRVTEVSRQGNRNFPRPRGSSRQDGVHRSTRRYRGVRWLKRSRQW
jgi:transcriptional antiterminator NusG